MFSLETGGIVAIKVQYRGYDLFFERYPTPAAIQSAYTLAEARVREKLRQPATHSISRVPREEDLPLSFAQEWLWSLDQLIPGSPAYNLPIAIRLTGRLDESALKRSLNEIVRRHESLRTRFPAVDGKPKQVIAPFLSLTLPVIELGQLEPFECEAAAQRWVSDEIRQPFDLANGPLLRAQLLRLAEGDQIILLILHHIISDAWSTGVLIKEITTLYQAYTEDRPSPLPELPIQYADFAYWQRRHLQGETLENLVSYWRSQLDGAPAVLQIPTDHPRPPVQTFASARQTFVLSASLSEGIRALSRREGVTLFMTLLAAFQTLLYRLSGQPDIVVGSPIAGRNRAELEQLIGCFINTLPLRSNLAGNPRFRDLLNQVREVTTGAYANQDLPFERMVTALQLKRSAGYTPVFQALFDLVNTPAVDPVESQEGTMSPMNTELGAAKLDILMGMWEGEGKLQGFLDYKTDLFNSATIRRMLGGFETLLGGVVAQPECRLDALEIVSEDEKLELLREQSERETLIRQKFSQIKPKAIKLPMEINS